MVVMMAAMMMAAADRLRQVLHVGELTALRGVSEVRREGVEFVIALDTRVLPTAARGDHFGRLEKR